MKNRGWVNVMYRKCTTPDKLKEHKLPVTVENIDLMLNDDGSVMTSQIATSTVTDIESENTWRLYERLYLGIKHTNSSEE